MAGLRAGEMRGLKWGDVANGEVTIRRALDVETDAVVAPEHDKVPRRGPSPAEADRLLRHTFGTEAAGAGVPLPVLQC